MERRLGIAVHLWPVLVTFLATINVGIYAQAPIYGKYKLLNVFYFIQLRNP